MDDSLSLDIMYRDSCRRHQVLPNASILSCLIKAEEEKSSSDGKYRLVLVLDGWLNNADIFPPLMDLLLKVGDYVENIDLVDDQSSSPNCLLLFNADLLMSLMRLLGEKLNLLHLHHISKFGDHFFSDLSQTGISCKMISLCSIGSQKLSMIAPFSQLHTLNLDFCTSITTFHPHCFSLMPNLARLSMCETRVANLWTTVAVLSNLPSLLQLRFQKCPCCRHTAPCPSLYANYLAHQQTLNPMHHPSPICYEKHYRQYMVVSLPRLHVLDNLPILDTEKHTATNVFSSYYEYLPYKWRRKESVVNVLLGREMGSDGFYHPRSFKRKKDSVSRRRTRCFFFPNALSAMKLGSSPWPLIEPISNLPVNDEIKRLRPRQFEYHPSDSGLMVFGTLDGEIVVINHENGKVVHYGSSVGEDNSIIGLCWLKKYPSKLIAGSDNGAIKLFDITSDQPKACDPPKHETAAFEYFEQLTSVHVNSTDEWFIASGYSRDIALYDIATARRMELFTGMHREPINVAKFAHHSPFMFATSSFDRDVKMWDLREKLVRPCYTASSSRGNVMVCFSHDDLYLLVSAVDNEVKQLLAVDGSLHTQFQIATTGSAHNYTRSYYINGRDYIISGSCDEPVIRICCAQTGRRLRDVHLEEAESGNPLYVQSLRGDPFRNFHLSALTAPRHPSSKCDIMKINLLASDTSSESSHILGEYLG